MNAPLLILVGFLAGVVVSVFAMSWLVVRPLTKQGRYR